MQPQNDPRQSCNRLDAAVRSRSRALLLLPLLAGACKQPVVDPGIVTSVVTIPSSWTISATGGRVSAVAPDGLVRWTAVLPQQDRISTPIAAAADGTVYLRGRAALHALDTAGKWRWHRGVPPLPAQLAREHRPIFAPIAMTDSTVAMLTDEMELTAFDDKGEVRWRRELPGDGPPRAPPRCAPNGQIVVALPAGLVAVSPTGRIDWQAEESP